ncbi:uncharacterized protein TNCV_4239681 [Trichonephila clavipes]|nr:uncharacterized protein TNCV_4239681 [Trichonephila clavipes]
MREDACVRTCQPDYIWSEKLKDLSIADVDTRGLLVTCVTLNHGLVTRRTPELVPPYPNFHNAPTGGRLSLDRFNLHRLSPVQKIKDEVEKLAYKLNEEAEWTERPIRRLSKVMYGSTCADMQVDVMGECLSSIKHIVGTTSGCFLPEVESLGSWRKAALRQVCLQSSELLTASFHDFGDNFKLQEQLSGGSVVVLHEEPHPQMAGTLSYRPEETGGRWGEIARHTLQATGRPISRFTVARRLHGGGLFERRPVRCVPLMPAHRRRRSLWCREHRNWRDNEWGRVLFTDENRFSLSSDSHRILI